MNFFKVAYDKVIVGSKWLAKNIQPDFLAFCFLALALVCFIVGIFTMCFSQEAKTSKKLVKVNKLLLKNNKKKSSSFLNDFHKLMLKGNDRVKASYFSYLTSTTSTVLDIFTLPRLQAGFVRKQNNVKKVCNALCFLSAFMFFGIYAYAGLAITEAIYRALIFPIIILVAGYLYSIIFKLYATGVENALLNYTTAISDSISPYFANETENLETLKKDFCKLNNIAYGDEIPAELPGVKTKGKQKTEKTKNAPSEEDYAKEIARLSAEKQKLEDEIAFEREKLLREQEDLENQIKQGRLEINNVENQIARTDSPVEQESLKNEQSSQEKFVEALEKLKQTKNAQFEETEQRLQAELKKVDEMLNARKQTQNEQALNVAEQTKQELQLPAQVVNQEETTQENLDGENQVVSAQQAELPPQEEKPKASANKNINDALNDLLTTMNKYKKKNEDK